MSVKEAQDWAAIFIGCLGCLNVEKWVNNFKGGYADQIVLNALDTCQFIFST